MKLVIVEDDKLLLENLRLLLNGEPGIEVSGAFLSAEKALLDMEVLEPDILLVDLELPGMSGIDLIKIVKKKFPDMDIMAHTVFDSKETVFSAIKAGASGYLLKGLTPRELIEALHNLHEGGAPMSAKIARSVIREFQNKTVNTQELLSPREREILVGLEKGLTYNELSENLNISYHTVHTHIKNIYEKLHTKGKKKPFIRPGKKE